MARDTMEEIIAFTQTLIDDAPGAAPRSDDEVEAALDNNRINLGFQAMMPVPTFSGGRLVPLTWETPLHLRWVEEGALLYDASNRPLTPTSSVCRHGRFVFASEPVGPVYVAGYSYDPYGAAYDLLRVEALNADSRELAAFTARNGSFTFNRQLHSPLYRLTREYLSRSRRATFMSVF